ncbi:MAG: MotA/TolQ/ExbB proton channel family protein [Mariprofundaceae bacterium]|nr:MotA/TolQ/ExbB proton channel family protein [Mariprofundaceae bacterium]
MDAVTEVFVFEFIQQGGAVMYILLGLSVLALTIIFERSWSLRRSVVIPLEDVEAIEKAVLANDVDGAIQVCRSHNTAMSRILWVALKNRGVKRAVMKEILEEVGRQEVAHLDRFIGVLGVVAAISPLLGLLGTVVGMIEVFQQISLQGVGKADVLAGGISKALNTTAAGLSIAVPALVAYRLFDARVNRFVVEIEQHALRFVELLKGER